MNPLTVLPLLFPHTAADRAAPPFDAIRKGETARVRALIAADSTLAGARNSDANTRTLGCIYASSGARHCACRP
jgi:hypothetical protein